MEYANKKSGESGFTLVEVLIATLVLAIGLLSIAQAFAQGMVILVNTPTQLAAKEFAFEIIDDYVVLCEANLPLTPIGEGPLTTRDGRTFLVSAATSGTDCNNIVTVDVTVSYCTSCGGVVPTNPNAPYVRNYSVRATINPPVAAPTP